MNPKSGVNNSDFLTPSEVPAQAELRLDHQGLVVSGLTGTYGAAFPARMTRGLIIAHPK